MFHYNQASIWGEGLLHCVLRVAFSNALKHVFAMKASLSANGTGEKICFQSPISFSLLFVMEYPQPCTKLCDKCSTMILLILFDYKDLAVSPFFATQREDLSILHVWKWLMWFYLTGTFYMVVLLQMRKRENKAGVRPPVFLLLYKFPWTTTVWSVFYFQIHILHSFRWPVPVMVCWQDLKLFFFLSAAR